MAVRVTPAQRLTTVGQHADMERSIAVSARTTGSAGLYSSIVTTAPGARTRIHHHGPCETSIYILEGRARYTWGPTGLEQAMDAEAGTSCTSRPARSTSRRTPTVERPLVVVLTRNCPDSHVVYLDEEPTGPEASRLQ